MSTNTHIFTNRDNNTLIREFEGVLCNNSSIKNLDAVVGFLRASGYFSLRPFLDNINKARILIGIDVDKYIAETVRLGELFHGAEENVKTDCLSEMRKDIERSAYKKEIEDGIFQMMQDLHSGKLELRAHPSKKIHAKIYVLYPDDFNQHKLGMMITGSSNLSGNGLGISADRQYEFNIKLTEFDDVQFARDEFEKLWQEAKGCPITAEDVKKQIIEKTYLDKDISPYELYIKTLMEYFSDRVVESPLDLLPDGYEKYDYQMDAVMEGYQKLLRYDGFFLADVVGLGKTVIATMIAKKFLIENGRDKTKILVVYPPALKDNWIKTFKDFDIDKYAKFISNGSLMHILENKAEYWTAADYDLVLVDESHKFRSANSEMFANLQEICKTPRNSQGHITGYKKKVMLISATPMNNSPQDIYSQIQLFQDSRRCTIDGVANLASFFNSLIVKFNRIRAQINAASTNKNQTAEDQQQEEENLRLMLDEFKRLAEHMREHIIKPLTVRRTRTDIESIERYNKDVNGFPKVSPPIKSYYELNEHVADLFERAMNTLAEELEYARYRAIDFLKDKTKYPKAESISATLASIRKTGMVKRLESSFYAFKISIENFRQANQNMIDMFEKNKIFIAPDLDINELMKKFSEEEIEEKLNKLAEEKPSNAVFTAADFEPEYIELLKKDQAILERMYQEWAEVGDAEDSKFVKFNELLQNELLKQERNPEQKLVVFSESVDTVKYLERRIGREDVLAVCAENRKTLFNDIQENFDANSRGKKLNKYNIIITSDVLAEGVNLHRSNVIVNYDTPWNSTKLMQRIGRVNRIGSKSKNIYNYVFYPSREGNQVIRLNQIALRKIQMFHSTYSEDNKIYGEEEILETDTDKLFDQAVAEQAKELNLELQYYEELRNLYINDRKEYDRIAKLSLRSRTGRTGREINGCNLSGSTLVFLKTNFRNIFFRVANKVSELSVLDALGYFKAAKEEKSVKRIAAHHDHVGKALRKFQDIQSSEKNAQEATVVDPRNQGVHLKNAMALLNSYQELNTDEFCLVDKLKSLAERGVLVQITRILSKMHTDLSKQKMTYNTALAEILQMARTYSPLFIAEDTAMQELDAEIILSESFTEE